MKRYAFLIIVILIIVFSSGCSTKSQTYNKNGISFNYPLGWKETPQENLETFESIKYIARVYNESNNETFAEVETTDPFLNQIVPPDQVISEKDITINGVKGREVVFNYTSEGKQKVRMIVIDKPTKKYVIKFYAPSSDFDSQQSNFDMIVNSLQGI